MTKINKIKLISQTSDQDEIGQITPKETSKEIIAEVVNVSRTEFMEGSQNGLSPAFSFRISSFGYSGEKTVEYLGARYEVYRVYEADQNYIELYCQFAVGV